MLEHDGTSRLGQVLALRLEQVDAAEVGWEATGGGPAVQQPARDPRRARRGRDPRPATARRSTTRRSAPRPPDEVARLAGRARRAAARGCRSASCGSRRGVPFALDAGGFDRHTFFCGQSGSGKTYSLGVVLEQLLLRDEPADRDPRPELRLRPACARCEPASTRRPRSAGARSRGGIDIRSRRRGAPRRLAPAVRASSSRDAQAAMLRLDPVADREEYAALDAAARRRAAGDARRAARRRAAGRSGRSRCASATSASTAGACGRATPASRRSPRWATPRCLVLDLGSLDRTRSRRSSAARCSARCGSGAPTAGRC